MSSKEYEKYYPIYSASAINANKSIAELLIFHQCFAVLRVRFDWLSISVLSSNSGKEVCLGQAKLWDK